MSELDEAAGRLTDQCPPDGVSAWVRVRRADVRTILDGLDEAMTYRETYPNGQFWTKRASDAIARAEAAEDARDELRALLLAAVRLIPAGSSGINDKGADS